MIPAALAFERLDAEDAATAKVEATVALMDIGIRGYDGVDIVLAEFD